MRVPLATRYIVDPDGDNWRVSIRWIGKPLPGWRSVNPGEAITETGRFALEASADSLADETGPLLAMLVFGALMALGAVLILLILAFPVIAMAIELTLLLALLLAGFAARVLLLRPWKIEAELLGRNPNFSAPPAIHKVWSVRGVVAANRALAQLATSIHGGVSEPLLAGARREKDV